MAAHDCQVHVQWKLFLFAPLPLLFHLGCSPLIVWFELVLPLKQLNEAGGPGRQAGGVEAKKFRFFLRKGSFFYCQLICSAK